jgi:hypothetical protein
MGDDSDFVFRQKLLVEDGSVRQYCRSEAARSVLAKVRNDVFARFHAVDAKRRSRTRNSHFGLLGSVLRTTTTTV